MKKLLIAFSFVLVLSFSCGEAGIETIIIDDFTYETSFTPQVGQFSYSSGPKTTDIQEEIKDFGNEILDLDISKIEVSIKDLTGGISGFVDVSITGVNQKILEKGELFNGQTIVVTDNAIIESVKEVLENNDLTYMIDTEFTVSPGTEFTVLLSFFVESKVKAN
ncbi:MAG: hypothetical protein AAF616_14960 [Bacteroidota bacterium]